jgi:hypothetical protein
VDFEFLDISSQKERNDLEVKDNTMVTSKKCVACRALWPPVEQANHIVERV